MRTALLVAWVLVLTGLESAASAQVEPAPAPEHADGSTSGDLEAAGPLSVHELAELGFDMTDEEVAEVDTALRINGFADFSVNAYLGSKLWRRAASPHPSFYIGNFNLYISKALNESFRFFSEVRLTYLPNGSRDLTAFDGSYTSTLAYDYNDGERPLRWGAIEIERVYLDWALHPLLTMRVGQFLTPYGVWNVDHGSPAIVPVNRPFIVAQALFPERQMGFELFGLIPLAANHVLGYHLTLSNGLGPVAEYRDLDNNKAVGGRVFWRYDGLGVLQLGGSGFYGRETYGRTAFTLDPSGATTIGEFVDEQSDVLALAADLRWAFHGLLLQAELITQQRVFTADGRVLRLHPVLGRSAAPPDTLGMGGYALAGYRFGWLGVMPYLQVQYMDFVDPERLGLAHNWGPQVGLNVRPYDFVVFKLEYSHLLFLDKYVLTDDSLQRISAQTAWAF